MLRVTFLCTDKTHPIYTELERWALANQRYCITIASSSEELSEGDFLFLISCSAIISYNERRLFRHVLVVHASDLPHGRGWSPHVWQVLEGRRNIVVSLLEAEDKVDTGKIWAKESFHITPTDLFDEINRKLFDVTFTLIEFALNKSGSVVPRLQNEVSEATYYRKRVPADSELDISKPLADQFDLLRVCDPDRYPAYIILDGKKFLIRIERAHD